MQIGGCRCAALAVSTCCRDPKLRLWTFWQTDQQGHKGLASTHVRYEVVDTSSSEQYSSLCCKRIVEVNNDDEEMQHEFESSCENNEDQKEDQHSARAE